jgi:hypothetical protein
MNDTTNTTNTTTKKLISIISGILPNAKDTGIINHLWAIFHPTNKGKAIVFTWNKERFRLTANHKVQQYDFTNTLIDTDEAKRIEGLIKENITA